ncbi:MAG: deoxyribonuclease IV [Armatimonadetes bacterium]|nr:deoxyribonuclease IV [Armatimonadota bacterium]
MRLGFHVPIAGGLSHCLHEARLRRCQTLQIFTSAPVQWALRPFDTAEAAAFVEGLRHADMAPLFIHAPYLLNLASPDRLLRRRSTARLVSDLRLANQWGAAGVVLHLGSGGESSRPASALKRVAASLREALDRAGPPALAILENCAGQGNIVGATPEELGEVVALCGSDRLGLCLDTAHAFAAGFAIHQPEGLDDLLSRLAAACGDLLRLVHANDSLAGLGSNRDRHWHIGRGAIGPLGWRTIMSSPRLRHLPFIMETPKGPRTALQDDLRNLRALRRAIPADCRPPLPPAPKACV